MLEWTRKNADKWNAYRKSLRGKQSNRNAQRRHKLKKMYGLDEAAFAAMVAAQRGLCAICQVVMSRPLDGMERVKTNGATSMCVDHCHKTGRPE